jgi:chromosome segregation ATPase
MKTKIAFVIVLVICVGLGIALITRNKQAAEQHDADVQTAKNLSDQLVSITTKEADLERVNTALDKDLTVRKTEVVKLSNDLTQVSQNLAKSESALKSALEENAKRDAKIAELENQKEALDKKASDLQGSITDLEVRITDTQKKLSASEGDKAFLEKELKRLMAEKAELERQFNDLAVVRQQLRKLKEELAVSRRLAWQNLFAGDDKGATRLMQGANTPRLANNTTNVYDLNVEVNSDGSVKVIPPLTNAPAPPKQ